MLNEQINDSDLEASIKQDIEVSIKELSQDNSSLSEAVFDSIRTEYE